MIFLRTAVVDENVAGASPFVSVEQPVGIADGDLLVLAVTVNATDVVVTPPDASWTRVAHTDKTAGVSLWVWWKFALNEPVRWVFSFDSSVEAMAAVAVYGGADGWEPVEAYAAQHNAAAGTAAVGGFSTSVGDEELVLFVSSDTAGTFTPATGFQSVASTVVNGALAVHRKQYGAPTVVSGLTVPFSVAGETCSFAVVLRPSVSKLSLDDVRKLLVGGLPADADRVYDLDGGGSFYKLFQAVALAAKQVAFDLVELCQLEILPRFARYKLPDWERVFGLTTTRQAQVGSIPARQAQVVSSWREAAGLGSTRAAITAILGPLLGYDVGTEVEIVTTDRDLLSAEHRYSTESVVSVADGDSGTFGFTTIDGGKVSTGGARVLLEYGTGSGAIVVRLTAPDGTTKSWDVNIDGQAMDLLFGVEFVDAEMMGPWLLEFQNDSGGLVEAIMTVFVEGVTDGRNDGQITAAAMFDWGVYADPAHLGENGLSADLVAARRAVQRIAFAHTQGNLLQSLTPYPDEDAGLHAAIPDECIPTA